MTESWVPPERDVSSLEALRVRVLPAETVSYWQAPRLYW